MKTPILALMFPLVALVSFSTGCPEGGLTNCATDADCDGTSNDLGDGTPTCDVDSQICVPDSDQCDADVQCQATDIGATDTCSANPDCGEGDKCVDGADGVAHCVTVGGNCPAGSAEVTADDANGEAQTFCADPSVTCSEENVCTGGTFE